MYVPLCRPSSELLERGDEGGWLKMTVRATTNDYDFVVGEPCTGYNVWRLAPAKAPTGSAAGVLSEIARGGETAGMILAMGSLSSP